MHDRRRLCGRDSESNDWKISELLSGYVKVDEAESDGARNERWRFEFNLEISCGGL